MYKKSEHRRCAKQYVLFCGVRGANVISQFSTITPYD